MARDFSPGVPGSPYSGLQRGGSRLSSLGLPGARGQGRVTQASTGSAHAGQGREGQADSKLTPSSHAAKKPPPQPA